MLAQFAWICLLSIMVDENNKPLAQDNLRTLLFYLGLAIDDRLSQLRRGTPYEKVRPSDVRVFARALRKSQTISEIAREMRITRQAAQSSVQRLMKLQLLELESIPNNKRDKLVRVTPRGVLASKTAGQQIGQIEAEFASFISKDKVEEFRKHLEMMLDGLRDKLRQQA
jgi:DNA-binding MarR family transcriptional regulator